jgi:glycosyltransferase involved in cell wall biosynthesis
LPGGHLRLLIAGHAHDAAYGAALQKLAEGDQRIRLDLTFVADEDIQYYMRAADVCVLPYRSGTTSGAALLAFSFGCPLIAPDVFPFRPLLAGGSGLLYSNAPDALAQALADATQMDIPAASERALAVARRLDWQLIARQHLSVYQEILKP